MVKINVVKLWSATEDDYMTAEDEHGLTFVYVDSMRIWLLCGENTDTDRVLIELPTGAMTIEVEESVFTENNLPIPGSE